MTDDESYAQNEISHFIGGGNVKQFRNQVSENAAVNYEQIASLWMLPWAENLVASANLTAGERVLDLACGTGFVGRTAKPFVGAEGVVIGVDLNPMMVAVARSITGLDVREVSADATGLDSGSFDVVLCQQGIAVLPRPGFSASGVDQVPSPRWAGEFFGVGRIH